VTALIANATTRTTAAEFTETEWVDTIAIDAAYSARVMRPLMAQRSLAGKPTNTINVPAWNALTAAAVAETADLVNTAINPTEVTASVGEVGVMTTLTDALTEDDIFAGLQEYATQLGRAIADKEDADAAVLLASFSNSTGTTAQPLTQGRFLAALRALEARDAPKPYVAVLHPVQAAQLANDVVVNGGNVFAGAGDARWGGESQEMWGSLFGIPIYQTTNVSDDATDYFGGIFSRGQALMHIAKRDVRIEFERDASFRLTEVVATARYAVVELVDNYGQEILSGMTA
jgi:N4-gp56 family major capsid protein